MPDRKRTVPKIMVLDNAEADRLIAASLLKKEQSGGKMVRLRRAVREVAGRMDRAITLGVASAYPIVFNMPTPDPVPDWKHVVRVGWKLVRTTVAETIHILTDGERRL